MCAFGGRAAVLNPAPVSDGSGGSDEAVVIDGTGESDEQPASVGSVDSDVVTVTVDIDSADAGPPLMVMIVVETRLHSAGDVELGDEASDDCAVGLVLEVLTE